MKDFYKGAYHMKCVFWLHHTKWVTCILFPIVFFWCVPPVLALDPSAGQDEKSVQSSASTAGQLPSLASVAKKAMPAVVNVSTTQKVSRQSSRSPRPTPNPFEGHDPAEEFFRRFFGEREPSRPQRSLGSGFIISEDGYIITNNHVIGDAAKITVRLSDKEEYEAKVIGTDDKTDIGLIKIDVGHPLPTVPLGESAALEIGDWVIAIGNPFGLEETVTAGIVSAKGRAIGAGPYDDFIQTDASINPGNSGGPLLNLKGEVVGINTAIFSQSGGNIGIGFATPIDLAESIITQLKNKGKVTRGWLGVSIQEVTPELAKSFGLKETIGALIADVTKDSPADKAGLQRGDVITKFNGTLVKDSRELPTLVAQGPVGEKVDLTVLRGGQEKTVTVALGELPADSQARAEQSQESTEKWGLTVAELTPDVARRFQLEPEQQGVVVVDIEPGSPAELQGLQRGDLIEEVDRTPVKSVEDFEKAVTKAQGKDTLLLLVRRGEATTFFALNKAA
jgi:serine protease Do